MHRTKHSRYIITILLASLFLAGCRLGSINTVTGSGVMAEETREINGVTSVKYSTLGQLIITVGENESLTIEGEDNMFAYLLSDVDNGKITIQSRPNLDIEPTKSLTFYLTVKSLESIEITSSGDIEAPNLEADEFVIKISSSGNLVMDELEANSLEVTLSSSGNLDIAGGEVSSQTIKISSSGNYNAEDLESEDAEVKLTSSGSASIWVKNSLTADLNSSGDLRYRGNPSVDSDISSSGEVIQIDD
jgi:hypothetical protein